MRLSVVVTAEKEEAEAANKTPGWRNVWKKVKKSSRQVDSEGLESRIPDSMG